MNHSMLRTVCFGLVTNLGAAALAESASAAEASAASASGQLEEVLVTASRRSESAQKSSLAIQVVDASAIEQQGVVQPRDLMTLVPALNVGSRGSIVQLYIRGIGAFVTTPQDESPVAVNLDQAYLSSAAGISGMFFDVERLEVLKGPQGTLYGRNASGGALNIVTRKPDFSGVNGYASVDLGNYELKHVDGALNVPVSDSLAIRGAFQVVDRDGYYNDGTGDDEHQSARLHALWRRDEALSLLVTGDYTRFSGRGEGYSMYPRVDAGDPYIGLSDPRVNAAIAAINPTLKPLETFFQNDQTYGIQANLQWDLGAVTLNVIPAWRRTELDFMTGGVGSVYPVKSTEPQSTLEVRLSSNSTFGLRWVAGAYYFDVEKDFWYWSDFGVQNQSTIENGKLENRSYAGFAEGTLDATERLRLIAGLRYTHETKDLTGSTDTTTRGVRSLVPAAGELSFSETTGRVGLEYDVAPSVMTFLTVSTGFKAGGIMVTRAPDGTPNNPFPNTYDPEVLTAYTLGLKSRWLDERMQVNLEAFYWDYEDQQVTQVGPVNPVGTLGRVFSNVPDSPTLYGLDASFGLQATPADLLTLDVAYLNTEYDRLVVVGTAGSSALTTGCAIAPAADPRLRLLDCSGFPMVRAPEWSGSVGYRRTFNMRDAARVIAGLRTQYSSGYFTATTYLPWQWQREYTNTAVDLTYEAPGGRWSVTAYAKNLEDKAVSMNSLSHPFATGVSFDVLGAPRTYGVRARVDF